MALIHVGFTGSQSGMTAGQLRSVLALLQRARPTGSVLARFHHGMCIGSDAQAHYLARAVGLATAGHPGVDANGLSPKRGIQDNEVDLLSDPLPYLERNRVIVDVSRIVIATPSGFTEERRSGTWSTLRYAQRIGKRYIVVFPDGATSEEPTDDAIAVEAE